MYRALITVLLLQSGQVIAAEPPKRPPPAVTEFIVESRTLPKEHISFGTLRAARMADLHTETSGRITGILVKPGERVSEGTLMLTLDSRETEAQLKSIESQLKLANQQFERLRSLVKTQAGSAEKLDLQAAQVAELNARLELTRLKLEQHQLRAPFSGVLGSFDWAEGSWLSSSSAFTTLDDLSDMRVSFALPEQLLRTLQVGDSVEISSAAWPGETFTGSVSLIEARMHRDRATINLEAKLENPERKLRPQMLVRVSFDSGAERVRVAVPARTVFYDGDQARVLKIDNQQIARPVSVVPGQQTAEWIEIIEGLSRGDRIVDRGLVKAKPNRAVKIITTAENGQ